MALGLGSTFGVFFEASQVSEEAYDPVYKTDHDGEFLYQLLPSYYRNLMADREIYRVMWEGMMQTMSAFLLDTWQTDYAKSLRDVPVISQRKWIHYDFTQTLDFLTDPELVATGLPNLFPYNADTDVIDGVWTARAGLDKAVKSLNGDADEDTSLEWSFQINVESIQPRAAALIGYYSSTSPKLLRNALTAGVFGDITDELPRLFVAHYDPAGNATFTVNTVPLVLGTDYRVDVDYIAGNGTLVAAVTEITALKFSGTSGSTEDPAVIDVTTNQLTDDTVNFEDEDVLVGDLLVLDGEEYEIVSVDGSTLTTQISNLPEGAENLIYEIRGEVEIASVSLDLPNDTSDPRFTVNEFGTSIVDIRTIDAVIFDTPGLANRKTVVATTKAWTYVEPTIEEDVLTVPMLQDTITDPQTEFLEGVDFYIEGSTFKFQEPPPQLLWAEYAGYDEQQIRNNFGLNVGLDEGASDLYKAKVRGLYYAFFQGPRVEAIRIGVHIQVGLPIADKAGTVEALNPAFSGVLGLIRVAGIDYFYPNVVGTPLSVGDDVALFAPLSNGVEIVDYKKSDWWVNRSDFNELEKFHTFAVFLNLDAFALTSLQDAAGFVDDIKPTWKRAFFFVYKELEDEVPIDDDIAFAVTLKLYDDICDGVDVYYDQAEFEGDEADWKFDQGVTEWSATSAAQRSTATLLTGTIALTNSGTGGAGTSTDFVSEIGGPGAVADKRIAVALITTGTAGETTAASNDFKDSTPGAFDDIIIGDHITITGEGEFHIINKEFSELESGIGSFTGVSTFEDATATWLSSGIAGGDKIVISGGGPNDGAEVIVSSVDSETSITIVGTATLSVNESYSLQREDTLVLSVPPVGTATGLAWTNIGELLVWGTVDSVTDADDLVLDTGFGGVTGEYVFALLDNNYFKVYFDHFVEACPDEELTFQADLSPGYEETILTGRLSFSSSGTTVTGTSTLFESEINAAGASTDKYITLPDGNWAEVASITSDTELELSANAPADYTDVKSFLADTVPGGTATFTNGSADIDGAGTTWLSDLAVGDYVQIVPTQDTGQPVTSTPVVQVLTVNADSGVGAVTLSANYTGDTAAGVKIINRGASGVLPLSQDLPDGQASVANLQFTDWFGTAGGSISSTVAEQVP